MDYASGKNDTIFCFGLGLHCQPGCEETIPFGNYLNTLPNPQAIPSIGFIWPRSHPSSSAFKLIFNKLVIYHVTTVCNALLLPLGPRRIHASHGAG